MATKEFLKFQEAYEKNGYDKLYEKEMQPPPLPDKGSFPMNAPKTYTPPPLPPAPSLTEKLGNEANYVKNKLGNEFNYARNKVNDVRNSGIGQYVQNIAMSQIPFIGGVSETSNLIRPILPKVSDNLDTARDAYINSGSLGAYRMLMPENPEEQRKRLENPVANTVGNLAGYIQPGVAIEKELVKALPSVFGSTVINGVKKGLNPLTKMVLGGTGSGAVMGGIEGATEGIGSGMGVKETLNNIGNKAYDYAALGGAGSAVLGGAGNAIMSKLQFNKSMKNIRPQIEAYQPTPLTIPEFSVIPPKSLPRVSAEIPLKYQQKPVNTTPQQLLLPAPSPYSMAKGRTDNIGYINPNGLDSFGKQIANAVNDSKLSIDDLNTLKLELNKNADDILNNHIDYLNKSKTKGVNPGGLKYGPEGEVTGRFGRTSNNEKWYQDFYAENGRAPNQKEIKSLAEKHLAEGLESHNGLIPQNYEYLATKKNVSTIDSLIEQYNNSMNSNIGKQKNINAFDPNINAQKQPLNVPKNEPNINSPLRNVEPVKPQNTTNNIRTNDNLTTNNNNLNDMNVGNMKQGKPLELQFLNLQRFSGSPAGGAVESPTLNMIVDSGKNKIKVSDRLKDFYTRAADDTFGFSDFDKAAKSEIQQQALNSKKVSGTVDFIARENLVDKNGNVIGDGLSNIGKKIPKAKEKEFLDYQLHKHNIYRAREGKPVFPDYTPEQSANIARQYEAANPDFVEFSGNMKKFQKQFKKAWLEDTGMISKETSELWDSMYPEYIGTNRAFDEIEKVVESGGFNKAYANQSNPVKGATGSSKPIINPFENTLDYINRVVRVSRKNEVGQMVLKELERSPDELRQFAEILPAKPENITDNILSVIVNGEKQYIQVNNKRFLESLLNVTNNYVSGGVIKKLNQGFKNLITQYNPLFAFANAFRDFPTAYVKGSVKNPFTFTKNYFSAYKDIAKNSDVFKKYKGLGGSSQGFFSSEKAGAYKKEIFSTSKASKFNPLKAIKTFNELTETAPRLAEFKAVLEKTGDVQKALYASGEVTTNFARGGKYSKTIDIGAPYFNAAVQGLANTLRFALKNKAAFTAKSVAAITIPTAIAEVWNRKVDLEGYSKIDNRTRDENFLISTGDGNFIKIPKSRELGVIFSTLAQRLYRLSLGEEDSFKGFGNTVRTNFLPNNPAFNNLIAPVGINLPMNKDFADRPIVPDYMKNWEKRIQFDEKTSEIAKKIGDMTNLSPKQVDYIIQSYTGIIGQVLQPMTTESGNKNPLTPAIRRFTADSEYSNQKVTDFYDNMNELTVKAETKNQVEKIPSKTVTEEEKVKNAFTEASKYMSYLRKQTKTGTEEEKRQTRIDIGKIAEQMNKFKSNPDSAKQILPKLKPKGFDKPSSTRGGR